MLFLLNNVKTIVAVVVTLIISYALHSLDVYRLEAKAAMDLQAQATEMIDKCKMNESINNGVSNDYENRINVLNSQLASLQPSHCTLPITIAPLQHNAEATGSKSIDGNAIYSGTLYNFAAKAEKYKIQLIECQNFITETWKANQ